MIRPLYIQGRIMPKKIYQLTNPYVGKVQKDPTPRNVRLWNDFGVGSIRTSVRGISLFLLGLRLRIASVRFS
jgi:hypothetical protein